MHDLTERVNRSNKSVIVVPCVVAQQSGSRLHDQSRVISSYQNRSVRLERPNLGGTGSQQGALKELLVRTSPVTKVQIAVQDNRLERHNTIIHSTADKTLTYSSLVERLGNYLLLAAITVAITAAFAFLEIAATVLVGALLAAIVVRVGLNRDVTIPQWSYKLAQALLGASIGISIEWQTLRALGSDWPAVILVSIATLAVSIGLGFALTWRSTISANTAVLASVAGGAAGITAMARELGADERVVVSVQYLRVALIVMSVPLVIEFGFDATVTPPDLSQQSTTLASLAFAVCAALLGMLLGRLARLPAAPLFGSLIAAAGLHHMWPSATMPPWLVTVGLLIIGTQVGLRFTRSSLRNIARLLPMALITIFAVVGVCAVMGMWLSSVTGVSVIDGYLATTPGGVPAVLAAATSTNSNLTFVTSVQVVRIILVLVAAPVLAVFLQRLSDPPTESN